MNDKIKACCEKPTSTTFLKKVGVPALGLRYENVEVYEKREADKYFNNQEQRIAELEAENKRLSDAWELAANENNTLRLHCPEFKPIVESDFDNENKPERGAYVLFKDNYWYYAMTNEGFYEPYDIMDQFRTIEELNAWLKRQWIEIGGFDE